MARLLRIPVLILFLAAATRTRAGAGQCAKEELPCDSGEQCVLRAAWCDGHDDCDDDSDEEYCDKKSWLDTDPNGCKGSDTHFLCKSGICVPKVAVCDTHDDCRDNSDEKSCTTEAPPVDKSGDSDSSDDDDDDDDDDDEDDEGSDLVEDDLSEEDNDVMSFVPALPGGPHKSAVQRGVEWLLSVRHPNYGWGEDTARALIALGLANPHYFQEVHEDVSLMKKQLQVVVAVDMLKNQTHPVSISKLSLYINALLATCQDPFNFHGSDLVQELRQRVSALYSFRPRPEPFVNPVAHLTLCVTNQSTVNDVHNIIGIIRVQRRELRWQDMRALGIMALSCIIDNYAFASGYAQTLHQAVQVLLQSMSPDDGNFGNKYSTALAVQALLSVKTLNWDSSRSIESLIKSQEDDGSFGDLLSTYFILPSLSGQSLVRLKNMPCFESLRDPDGYTPLEVLLDSQAPRHYVRYSLLYGAPVRLSYSVLLQVPAGTKFFDVMRLAQHADPKFKFQHEESDGNIVVYAIGNVPNDAERGVYWQLYAKLNGRHIELNDFQREIGSNLRPFTKGVSSLVPKDRDHVAFWYRP